VTDAAFSCPPDCAKCCRSLVKEREPEEEEFLAEFDSVNRDQGLYTVDILARKGIVLTCAEARRLKEARKRTGAKARIVPHAFLLDGKGKRAIIASYRLDHAVCAFLDGYRCGAYEERPMPCRAFPVMVGAPTWSLAPLCPLVPEAQGKRERGVTYREQFRVEAAARRAIGRTEAATEEALLRVLTEEGPRLKRGLTTERAVALLREWPQVDLDALPPTG